MNTLEPKEKAAARSQQANKYVAPCILMIQGLTNTASAASWKYVNCFQSQVVGRNLGVVRTTATVPAYPTTAQCLVYGAQARYSVALSHRLCINAKSYVSMTRMYPNKCTGVVRPISAYKGNTVPPSKPSQNSLSKAHQKIIKVLNELNAAELDQAPSSRTMLAKLVVQLIRQELNSVAGGHFFKSNQPFDIEVFTPQQLHVLVDYKKVLFEALRQTNNE